MQIEIPDYFREDLLSILESKRNELRNDEDLYVYKFQQASRQSDTEDYAEILEQVRNQIFEINKLINQLDHV